MAGHTAGPDATAARHGLTEKQAISSPIEAVAVDQAAEISPQMRAKIETICCRIDRFVVTDR
jgi:hypothetical protein